MSAWGCPPLVHRASWIEGERRHGQGVDNPASAVPRAAAGPDQAYVSEEAASACAPASLDVVGQADAAHDPHRKEHRNSSGVGIDRPRSEHGPIHRESGRIGHDRNIALFEAAGGPMGRSDQPGIRGTPSAGLGCMERAMLRCSAWTAPARPNRTGPEGTPLPAPCRLNSDDAPKGLSTLCPSRRSCGTWRG